MNINEAFPSAFINAAALNGKTHTVQIKRFDPKVEMTDGELKPAIYFENRSAGLILNKTNATVLASIHGPETDQWVGRSIDLRVEKVSFQGQMMDGIRVAPATQTAATTPATPATPEPTAPAAPAYDVEDDVPF